MTEKKKTVVSPEPRQTYNAAFDDLDKYHVKNGQYGWVEKVENGWIACVSSS